MTTLLYGRPPAVFDPPSTATQTSPLIPGSTALEAVAPEVIAAGNIGCMMQIGGGTQVPVVHTVELLDWATGGPKPAALGS